MNAARSREWGIGNRESWPGVRGQIRLDEPMAKHTSWRVGGPADLYFEPAGREDLLAFVRLLPITEPVLWLGLGSNLLVRDGGWRGTVIALHGTLDTLQFRGVDGSRLLRGSRPFYADSKGPLDPSTSRPLRTPDSPLVYAEAGVHCARLAKLARDRQLAGLGFMAGIPGTVGGALAMNAGAWGGETWPVVERAEVLMRDGDVRWLAAGDLEWGYRHVALPADALGFLGAVFRTRIDADGEDARATRESLARRKATQPVGKPSAGSTFRNPPGDHAARLIEASGLKGYRIGGAQVSTLHANFIVTEAGARAADVEALILHLQAEVQRLHGVRLQTEVRIVGVAS